jgi:hypothetical protein
MQLYLFRLHEKRYKIKPLKRYAVFENFFLRMVALQGLEPRTFGL